MDQSFLTQVPAGAANFDGRPDQVIAKFYKASKHMPAESERAGHPVFKALDMVEIRQQGEVDNIKEEVHSLHKQRWSQQWLAYQMGEEQKIAGTPLIELFPANPEVVDQLKAVNIHTIEGLVQCPDSASTASTVPFLGEWKKRANKYVERMNRAGITAELEHRLAEKDALLKKMEERLAALEAAPQPKKKEAA